MPAEPFSRPIEMTPDERLATFHQAKVFMHAGISSSMAGNEEDALNFFAGAKSRFVELNEKADASIAQGWIEGLQDRRLQP